MAATGRIGVHEDCVSEAVARMRPSMSLREKIAQLVFVRIGSNMPPVRTVEQDEERVARLLEECPVGGLLLFNGGAKTKQSVGAVAGGIGGAAAGRVGYRTRSGAAGSRIYVVSARGGI